MNTNNEVETTKHHNHRRGGYAAGAILITIGVLSIFNNIVSINFGLMFLLALGLIFLVVGIVSKTRGFIIPGGIISGVGAATLVMTRFESRFTESGKGGIFLLVFSLGWLLISILSLIVPNEQGQRPFMWWPLIPGGIIGLTGTLLLQGELGLTILKWMGQGWPIVLIGLGLYLILRRKEMEE
jgi:hypothetical protein